MSRLVREVALMEVLDHENIVQLYETYETADALYLVMEYVAGYNLEEYLKRLVKGRLDENEARDIFRQVVMAVDHCHSKWVVHRDLKVHIKCNAGTGSSSLWLISYKTPNILLTADHRVKIADFGLGNRFGLTRLKTVCGKMRCESYASKQAKISFIGSMLYYSPEIISARSYVGPEVDSWCLGILLFRMTTGIELFSHAKSKASWFLVTFPANTHTHNSTLWTEKVHPQSPLQVSTVFEPWTTGHHPKMPFHRPIRPTQPKDVPQPRSLVQQCRRLGRCVQATSIQLVLQCAWCHWIVRRVSQVRRQQPDPV